MRNGNTIAFRFPVTGIARRAVLCVTAGAAVLAAPAGAATQGALGATSTGSITITATVPNRTQISGLTDITFTNVDPTTTASQSETNCVWSNTATKGYSITATGNGTSNAFTLASAGGATVPYSVAWAQSATATSGTALAAGTALTGQTSTATKPQCTSAPTTTSALFISIASTDLQNMVAATSYSGTLTLLVTPQ